VTTTLVIHVQPRAKRTEVAGWHGDAIKIRLAAPPVDGAANTELIRFLADRLGVPQASIRLAAGVASRRKRVELEGSGMRPTGSTA
jgi:uncharacterized protein (TIGR00251 family)